MGKRRQLIVAASFFFIWIAMLYAGADHPPPAGFLWLVLLTLIASLLVYFRTATYANWAAARLRFRLVRVILEGAAAGLAFALLAILLPANREASTQIAWIDYIIWFAVLGVVGAIIAAVVYFTGSLFNRIARHSP